MATTYCLDCERPIKFEKKPLVGQRIKCAACEAVLEIINIDPLELDWVYDGPLAGYSLLNPVQNPKQPGAESNQML